MKKTNKLLIYVIILSFLTGILSHYILTSVYIDTESPYFIGLLEGGKQPGDWISEDNIEVYQDKIVINIDDASMSRYAATGSMLPTLGKFSNGIKIKPSSPNQIQIGDIVSYRDMGRLIIHRVIRKGKDEKGVYFITKGDNNAGVDEKIYFEDIEYVTVALIY